MLDKYEKEFNYLESLRKNKKVNLYYTIRELQQEFNTTREKAMAIISEFINRYDELSNKYGW